MTEAVSDITIQRATALNLKDISLVIKRGCTFVTGPIGSGKTALLRHTIAAEAAARSISLLRPLSLEKPPTSQAIINNLPPVIFVSGENPIPPNHSAGAHLGFFKTLGRLLARSPFIKCLDCLRPQKIESPKEQLEKIYISSDNLDYDSIEIFAQVYITPSDLATEKNKWIKRGYENFKLSESTKKISLLILLDTFTNRESSKSRIQETVQVTQKFKPNQMIARFIKNESIQEEIKFSIVRECSLCGAPFPKISSNLLNELASDSSATNLNEAQRYALSGYFLNQDPEFNGERLIKLTFEQIYNSQEIFLKLDTAQQAALKTLSHSKLAGLKINTPLSQLESDDYLLINVVKAFSLTPPTGMIVLDEPFINPDSSHLSIFKSLINEHLSKGNSVIIAGLNSSFKKLSSQIIYLGPASGQMGGKTIPDSLNDVSPAAALAQETKIGLDRDSLLSIQNSKDPIYVDWRNIYHGKEKTVISALKISDELSELFASTVAAKSLGLNNKSFIGNKSDLHQAELIRYRGRTFSETCKLSLADIRDEFIDVVKIRTKVDPALHLGLHHLPLSQVFSTLSLREKVLLTLAGLVVSKPKNRVIEIKGLLSVFDLKNNEAILTYLRETIGKTNSISITI